MSEHNTDIKSERILERINKDVVGGLPAERAEGNRLTLRPTTMEEAMEFAKVMATTDIGLRRHLRGKVGACLAVCQEAWESGFSPYTVANKSYLVNDQIAYEAQYIHAKALASHKMHKRPRTSYLGDGPERQIKVLLWLDGEDEAFEYVSPKLKDIKTQNSPLWKAEPDQQLHYYGIRAAIRRHAPDILLGLYTPDEIDAGMNSDDAAIYRTVTEADRAARPTKGAAAKDDAPTLELFDADGVGITYDNLDIYLAKFGDAMTDLEMVGDEHGMDRLWEANGEGIGILRKFGLTAEADGLAAMYVKKRGNILQARAQARPKAETAPEAKADDAAASGDQAPPEKQPVDKSAEKSGSVAEAASHPERADAARAPTHTEQMAQSGSTAAPDMTARDPAPQEDRVTIIKPWVFKPLGGRGAPQECADGKQFAGLMRLVINEVKYNGSTLHTFAMMLNGPMMVRLRDAEPEHYQGLIDLLRHYGWEGNEP